MKLNGPVGNVGEFVYGLQRPRHGSMQDVYALELLNHGQPAAVLDAVRMAKEKDASALRFAGAFVAPPDSNMFPVPVRHDRSLQPLQGYRLQPLSKTNGKAPVLVLRVGPALPGQTKGFQYSRNNNVNLFYHTPDGTHYVVVYPVRIEYPNG